MQIAHHSSELWKKGVIFLRNTVYMSLLIQHHISVSASQAEQIFTRQVPLVSSVGIRFRSAFLFLALKWLNACLQETTQQNHWPQLIYALETRVCSKSCQYMPPLFTVTFIFPVWNCLLIFQGSYRSSVAKIQLFPDFSSHGITISLTLLK